jgi:hypothetical protein
MDVNDHTCDEESEGLIPPAPEAKSAAEVIQAEDDPVFRGSGVIGTFAAHSPKLMEQSIQQTKEQQ